jgi:hypothetical protein
MRKDVHLSEGDKFRYGLTLKNEERRTPLRGRQSLGMDKLPKMRIPRHLSEGKNYKTLKRRSPY